MMIKIARAKPSDAQKIRALETKVWKEEVTNRYDAPMFVRFGYAYVAKDRDKIIGALIAWQTRDNEIKVADWIVDERYRENGVGLRLYKRLLQDTKGKTIVSFVDTKNEPSLKAHLKLGFKVVKRVKDPFVLKGKPEFFVRKKN